MMGETIRSTSLLAALILLATTACAAEKVGVVKTLSGSGNVVRGVATMPLSVGLVLEAKDRVTTASASAVGVTLVDDSLIGLGPGSSIVLESFAFNPTTHAGGLELRLFRGALRMITGLISRQSPETVRVVTPLATIGMRGTDFIVEVPDER